MIHRTGVALIVIALAGCAQPEVPPDNFYRLYPDVPVAYASAMRENNTASEL